LHKILAVHLSSGPENVVWTPPRSNLSQNPGHLFRGVRKGLFGPLFKNVRFFTALFTNMSTVGQNPRGPLSGGPEKGISRTLSQSAHFFNTLFTRMATLRPNPKGPLFGASRKRGFKTLSQSGHSLVHSRTRMSSFDQNPRGPPFGGSRTIVFKTLSQGTQFFTTLFTRMSTFGQNSGGPPFAGSRKGAARPCPKTFISSVRSLLGCPLLAKIPQIGKPNTSTNFPAKLGGQKIASFGLSHVYPFSVQCWSISGTPIVHGWYHF